MKDLHLPTTAVLVVLLASTSSAQNWFDTGALPTEPTEGETFGAGDFDGDGDADLWFVEGSQNDWTAHRVLLGDGAGGFVSGPSVPLPRPWGSCPTRRRWWTSPATASPRCSSRATWPVAATS